MPIVSTSAFYDRSNQDLAALRARADSLQASIGSGERLLAASDDPVAAARLRMLGRADKVAAIDEAAAARASADLTLADQALSAFAASTIRVQELATQAANGILTAAQRAGIATELNSIRDDLIGLANSRDSAGHALFGGDAPGQAYGLGPGGIPIYQGTPAISDLPLGDGQSVKRGITGPQFLEFSVNGSPSDLFAVIKGLSDDLKGAAADPAQAARDALGALDTGLETITTQQTVLGARLNWIDLITQRSVETGLQRSTEEADLGGTDMALAVSQLQQTMTILEASQASFARLSSLSLFSLLR